MALNRGRRRSIPVMALSLCLAGIAPCAAGVPDPARPLSDLIADLGSSEIMKREEAMRVLATDDTISLPHLEQQLASATLSPEQRCRLLQAAKDRFMQSPRPAMGVQFDSLLPDRVAIEIVYPNFPAAEVLRPGDIIVACEGETLRSRSAWVRLGAHIFSREPGESVELDIRRGAEKLKLSVPLGRFGELPSRSGPGIDRLESAWELRSRRFRTEAVPIKPALPMEEWRPEPSAIEVQKLARFRDQLPQGSTPRVVAGGEARGGVLDYDELITMARQNPDLAVAGARGWNNPRFQQQLFVFPGNAGIMQTTQQELSSLENRRLALEKQLEALLKSVPPGDRTAQAYREQIDRIKLQIEAIKAEAAEDPSRDPVAAPGTGPVPRK